MPTLLSAHNNSEAVARAARQTELDTDDKDVASLARLVSRLARAVVDTTREVTELKRKLRR
jgi:hypothetical protein